MKMAKKSVNAGALIFRTVYVTLGIIGIIDSLGWFHLAYRGDWYVYYTNLSNYICFGIMFASLVAEARGKSVVLPRFRFYALVMIFVTLFVYNFLLAKMSESGGPVAFNSNAPYVCGIYCSEGQHY